MKRWIALALSTLLATTIAVTLPGNIAYALGDEAAPVLESLEFTPTTIDITATAQSVVVTARVKDDTGAVPPTMVISSDSGAQTLGAGSMTLGSGTITDGMWTRTVTVPTTAEPGLWTVTVNALEDTLGNSDGAVHRPTDKLLVSAVVTPSTPTFTDNCGSDHDSYTVPSTTGVEYTVGDNLTAAGTYPAAGTVIVSPRATAGYQLDGTASWTHTFDDALCSISASPTPAVSDTTPAVDQTLSAVPGTWAPAGVSLAYQWSRRSASGVETTIAGATNSSYKALAADLGYGLRVEVTGSLDEHSPISRASAWTSAVATAQFTSAPTPTITGVARVSMRLTANPGSWTPSATLKYQWYRVSTAGVSTAVSGATASSHVPAAADRGYRMKVRVTGSRTGYLAVSRYSAPSGAVQSAMVAKTPTISDTTPRVDQTLTAYTGTWSPTTVAFAYQWYFRNSAGTTTAIPGATAKTYKVNGKYAGYTLRIKVTGSKTGYAPTSKFSSITSAVAKATFSTKPIPTISGTRMVSKTLTANAGTWTPTPISLSYQWYRSGVAVSGRTAKTYLLGTGDTGKTITVKVTARRTGYTSATTTSAATVKIAALQLTVAQQQAVNTARSYLDFMAFSRVGLIEQLEYEGFSTADAVFAVDYLKVDWTAQAVSSARDYLDSMAFSRTGLIEQLVYEGFTTTQATYAVDHVGADWYEQAVLMAEDYLDYGSFSRASLIEQLEYEGFTTSQAEYAADQVGL